MFFFVLSLKASDRENLVINGRCLTINILTVLSYVLLFASSFLVIKTSKVYGFSVFFFFFFNIGESIILILLISFLSLNCDSKNYL